MWLILSFCIRIFTQMVGCSTEVMPVKYTASLISHLKSEACTTMSLQLFSPRSTVKSACSWFSPVALRTMFWVHLSLRPSWLLWILKITKLGSKPRKKIMAPSFLMLQTEIKLLKCRNKQEEKRKRQPGEPKKRPKDWLKKRLSEKREKMARKRTTKIKPMTEQALIYQIKLSQLHPTNQPLASPTSGSLPSMDSWWDPWK